MAKRKSTGRKPNASSRRGAPSKSRKDGARPSKPTQKSSSARSSRKRTTGNDDPRQRLQRVMAAAGVASRRECEIIIQEGRVEVDGQVVMELGFKVDPEKQEIYVDAEKLVIEKPQYFMLNKPPGVVSTSYDPSGRPRVIDLIETNKRVYNVGRLDQSSEGLILVTNDGQLAHRLTHPRYGVEKKYHVQVDGRPTPEDLKQLREGIYIAEGKVRASNIRYLKRSKNGCWLEIILDEGRNREIRRMLAAIGHKVRVLKRVAIGPLQLKDLPVGAHRPLTGAELNALRDATTGTKPRKRKPATTGKAKHVSEVIGRKEGAGKSSDRPGKRKSAGSKSAGTKSGGAKRLGGGKRSGPPRGKQGGKPKGRPPRRGS